MWNFARCSMVALVLVALAGGARADSPEEAIARIEAAQRDGDMQATVALLAEPVASTYQLMIDAADPVAAADKEFQAALDARFGPNDGARVRFPGRAQLQEKMKRTVSMTIIEKKSENDHLLLTVEFIVKTPRASEPTGTHREAWVALEKNGEWKVAPKKDMDRPDAALILALSLKSLPKLLSTVTENVKAGGFSTRDAACEEAADCLKVATSLAQFEVRKSKEDSK